MGGRHVTIIHDAFDLTVQPPPPTADMEPHSPRPGPLIVTFGGHYWRPVQTFASG